MGWSKNKKLAKLVGTRSVTQIASMKSSLLHNGTAWAMELANQPTQTPPPSCSSMSSGVSTPPSVSTPTGQHRGGAATPEQPLEGPPHLPTGGDTESTPTPSPTVRDILRQEDPGERTRPSAAVEMANWALRILGLPAGEEGGNQTVMTTSPQLRAEIPSFTP